VAELAISNIAWTNSEEPTIAKRLQELGVTKVEIAPTKRWEDPTNASPEEVKEYVDWWKSFGIDIYSFQSLHFARPDLKLFESAELRDEMLSYTAEFLRLAGDMGVKRLVFGSPKSRQRGELSIEEANTIARDFFMKLGSVAEKYDTILCIEPNAPQYNCDFMTNAKEGADVVRAVGSKGVGLHLDTACMALAGDDLGASIRENADILEHFHVSAPMLDRVFDRDDVDYRGAAQALRDIEYNKVISIEMRPGDEGENLARVEDAIQFVRSVFPVR